ncbi:MAG: DUF3788 domain-containing protein [Oscillospiraceae bacterium]|jgi:hypothetical protein|nr:DUF3788 domain-containing protein [Oscillospiraceae bacterium]
MEWAKHYTADRRPTESEIAEFIGNPLWEEMHTFLHGGYGAAPTYSYSGCSAQPGWNVKYQKAGRSLCTLYPMPGFFIALVVIGAKEMHEAELLMPLCSADTQELFAHTPFSAGGKWLMLQVTSPEIFEDVKRLVQVRRKIK